MNPSFLPPGSGPATMPGSVPKFPASPISGGMGLGLPPGLPPGAMPPLPPAPGGMPPGAIPGLPGMPGMMPPGSELPKYGTETQKDGSILLLDASGLVIQIIPPPKQKNKQPGVM